MNDCSLMMTLSEPQTDLPFQNRQAVREALRHLLVDEWRNLLRHASRAGFAVPKNNSVV